MATSKVAQEGPDVKSPLVIDNLIRNFGQGSLARELLDIFECLPDDSLLEAMQESRWTGRPGHPIRVMWHTCIAAYVLSIGTFTDLIRALHQNPILAYVCGIYSEKEIPHKSAYCRFLRKLVMYSPLVEECANAQVKLLSEQLPGFGDNIAIDSTNVHSYSHPRGNHNSDLEASWSVKRDKHGKEKWWYGYKSHILCDTDCELPICVTTTTAKVAETAQFAPLLEKAKGIVPYFKPQYVIADKGYDSHENHRLVVEDYSATPIILLNLRGHAKKFEDLCDEYGTPYCAYGVPMVFWGYDKDQKTLKYRCPLKCGKPGCKWLDKCSESLYGLVVKLKLKDDYRRFIRVPRHTKKWAKIYNKRGAIERINSRLKEFRRLDDTHLRGLAKISLHCLLAALVMQARALVAIKNGNLSDLRTSVIEPKERSEAVSKEKRQVKTFASPPTDYEQFKATIQRILRQSGKPMTWQEIKEAGKFPQKVPNNKRVKWMEEDIGLVRERAKDGKIVWMLK